MIQPKYEYNARIAHVVDGDTFDLVVDLGLRVVTKIRVRLFDWNAPEVSTDDGKRLRDWLRSWAVDKTVKVRTFRDPGDKYGRWLAEIEMNSGETITTAAKRWLGVE